MRRVDILQVIRKIRFATVYFECSKSRLTQEEAAGIEGGGIGRFGDTLIGTSKRVFRVCWTSN